MYLIWSNLNNLLKWNILKTFFSFYNISISLYTFLIRTALTEFQFHMYLKFYFIQSIFLNSSWDFFLIYRSLRCMLFGFQIFGVFPDFLLVLISMLIKNMHGIILILLKVSFMVQSMVYLGKRSMCASKECVFCCWWIKCSVIAEGSQCCLCHL